MMMIFIFLARIYLDIPDTYQCCVMCCGLLIAMRSFLLATYKFLTDRPQENKIVYGCSAKRIVYHSITFHITLLRLILTHYIAHPSSNTVY